ncbi:hypothetical protein FGB62_84g11 [Gracilaria domingensis]|nr:hypothetical protein FGB62_84g11 [Gracilaria domingensis]
MNGNVTDAAFHLAREILGHDCGANPLQMRANGAGVKQVELQFSECVDGVSADKRIVSRCIQVGSRFVEEASGGSESVK